jgi:hypothetical protein
LVNVLTADHTAQNWILSTQIRQIIYLAQFTKVLFFALGLALKMMGIQTNKMHTILKFSTVEHVYVI